MVKIENHIGSITISENYLRQLAESAVKDCFGVAGICPANPLKAIFSENFRDGIILYTDNNNGIVVELHIMVLYGINIKTVADSLKHKVEFILSEALGEIKCKVDVFIDDINS
ncbi:MAG: Asp23/Gls24 family envelope stress response protein [Oscillospiraceae bacterium]|nr:Asp23/Gls24 family envelope stress response protein [Oscillospiraceae bacterium]